MERQCRKGLGEAWGSPWPQLSGNTTSLILPSLEAGRSPERGPVWGHPWWGRSPFVCLVEFRVSAGGVLMCQFLCLRERCLDKVVLQDDQGQWHPGSPDGQWTDPGRPAGFAAASAIAPLRDGFPFHARSVGSRDTQSTSQLIPESFTQNNGGTLERATSPADKQGDERKGCCRSTNRPGDTGS